MAMVIDSVAFPLARQRATAPVAAELAERLGRRLEATWRVAWRAIAGAAKAGQRLGRWLQGGRSLVVLDGLSAHTLRDIGLERTSLARAVYDLERGFDPRRAREM